MSTLVVGEALIDLVTVTDGPPAAHVGGSPLNVAVGLARLGVATTFASQVGRDPHGEQIVQRLRDSGAAFSALAPTPRRTATAIAALADDGSARYTFDLSWDPVILPEVDAFDAVHVGSIATVLQPGAGRVAELAAAAHRLGVPVSFDPNVRLAVEPDARAWRRTFARILPHAGVIKLSADDAAVLFPGVAATEVATRLAGDDRLVVVTCGADGAHAATPTACAHVPSAVTELIDTIGAGDSFMAALIAWLVEHDQPAAPELSSADLDDLLGFAATAAAITCARPGADPPWTADLRRLQPTTERP
jgi:fructokinase